MPILAMTLLLIAVYAGFYAFTLFCDGVIRREERP